MTTNLLNVLYVLTPGTRLGLDHDSITVRSDGEGFERVPLMNLSGLVLFGRVSVSTPVIHRCGEDGRDVVWLDGQGRFKARIVGASGGNVLLRRSQHQALDDPTRTIELARTFVAAKLQNSRRLLIRGARDLADEGPRAGVRRAAESVRQLLSGLEEATTLNSIRGIEGAAARTYFAGLQLLLRQRQQGIGQLDGRSRRPPRDPVNAVLSFLYTLLRVSCSSALESVGLDPQVGYLHSLRPGRPALALDLMEELRPVVADRLALTLINKRQLGANDFEELPGHAVHLTDSGRKTVLTAWHSARESPVHHRLLRRDMPGGLVAHTQAQLLARHLRGDLETYPPFIAVP